MKSFNLDEEWREGYFISGEMKKIWAVQLDLLKKLLDVCERHHLKIFAAGGTMIGAVRHNGYIPWDDDIDMIMFREDYNKLLTVGETEFKHPYFLQSGFSDKKYPRGHAQLRNSETTAILPADILAPFNQGIFIDIFVLDALPEDKSQWPVLAEQLKGYRFRMHSFVYSRFLSKNPLKILHRQMLSLYFLFHPFKKVYRKSEEVFGQFSGNDSETISCFSIKIDFSDRSLRKKKWYDTPIYFPFEDIMIPVPNGYHDILTLRYGDYMTPMQAPSLHGTVLFDTNRPYVEVLKELRSKIPWYHRI